MLIFAVRLERAYTLRRCRQRPSVPFHIRALLLFPGENALLFRESTKPL
jgi:hypothetical protein